jgi:NAD(P)H-dependent FMN reductase
MSQPVDDAPVIIPVLLGSRRRNGNAAGLASWLGSQLTAATGGRFALVPADDLVPRMPYGPVEDPVIPVMVADRPDGYADADVRAWSALVERSPALVVLTPQFNWGYPGHLKNALDHIYHEWKGKPVLLFTYGGHGGSKCASQLHQVRG